MKLILEHLLNCANEPFGVFLWEIAQKYLRENSNVLGEEGDNTVSQL